MEFVRLLYVSKVTSSHPSLQEDLMDILDTAVDFNSRNGITGVLYYGHGYFVQCIEGSREKIETLFYHHILKDPRHQNCEILYYGQCEIGLFRHWNMKFAPINKRLTQFLLIIIETILTLIFCPVILFLRLLSFWPVIMV